MIKLKRKSKYANESAADLMEALIHEAENTTGRVIRVVPDDEVTEEAIAEVVKHLSKDKDLTISPADKTMFRIIKKYEKPVA